MSSDGEKELISPVLEVPTPPPVDSIVSHQPGDTPSTTSHTLSAKLKQLLTCPSKESHGDNEPTLKKEFTVLSGVGFIAGNIIGSGIFITPRNIFVNTGSFGLTLVAWVIGGLIALAGGLCYIELGVVIRKSGGEYPIIRTAYSFNNRNKFVRTLGAVFGFVYAWSSVIVIRSLSGAIVLLTFAQYLARPFYIECDPPKAVVTTLALAGLLMVALLNIFSVKLLTRVMTILTAMKVLALLVIVVVGIVYISMYGFSLEIQTPFTPHEGNEPSVTSVALGLYGVTFAYEGWSIMNYAIEEIKDVEKTLPRSLFIAVPMVMLCYILVNIAYFGVLSYSQILASDAIALTFGYKTLGKAGLVVIPLMVALSTVGSMMATMFSGSRLLFVSGRDGLFPQALSGLHRTYKTPVPAIMLMVLMVCVGILIGDVSFLLDGFNVVAFIIYAVVFIALLILRVTHRDAPRPFKAWFIVPVAVLSVLMSVFLVVFPVIQEPLPCLTAFAFLLSGLLVYPIMIPNTPWKKHLNTLSRHMTRFTMDLLNTEIATESTQL